MEDDLKKRMEADIRRSILVYREMVGKTVKEVGVTDEGVLTLHFTDGTFTELHLKAIKVEKALCPKCLIEMIFKKPYWVCPKCGTKVPP